MRNKWLVLVLSILPVIAAEKSRDWKTGQIVESKAGVGPQIHTITAAGKNYLVRGSFGSEETPTVGAEVRFAVEGKTMFVSIEGREYRLNVLGETVSTQRDAEVPRLGSAPAVVPRAESPQVESPRPQPPPPPRAAVKPAAEPTEILDNDAVVKMIVGGLKEDTVVRVIEARPGKYSVTPDALAALRAAGVPQNVITAMSVKMNPQR